MKDWRIHIPDRSHLSDGGFAVIQSEGPVGHYVAEGMTRATAQLLVSALQDAEEPVKERPASDLTDAQLVIIGLPGVVRLGVDAAGRPVVASGVLIKKKLKPWAMDRFGNLTDVTEPITLEPVTLNQLVAITKLLARKVV